MSRRPGLIEAKTVICKRCGDTQVAWVQSKRTGKWYLAQASLVQGREVASPTAFHKCERVIAAREAQQAADQAAADKAAADAAARAELAAYRATAEAEGNTEVLAVLDHLGL